MDEERLTFMFNYVCGEYTISLKNNPTLQKGYSMNYMKTKYNTTKKIEIFEWRSNK